MKKCSSCKVEKREEEFIRNRSNKDGLAWICKTCKHEYYHSNKGKAAAKKHRRTPEGRASHNRANKKYRQTTKGHSQTLKSKYGISAAVYDYIWDRQGGVCKICGKPNKGGIRLVVDHDHGTEKVRGLLCTNCNLMLGHSQDNPETLRLAIEYLEEN